MKSSEALSVPFLLPRTGELDRHVAACKAALERADDWHARRDALVKLHRLALGPAAEYDEFVPLLKSLHAHVGAQMTDLRSQLAREACALAGALARALGDDFAPLAELWLPTLLKVVSVTVQVRVVCWSRAPRRSRRRREARGTKLLDARSSLAPGHRGRGRQGARRARRLLSSRCAKSERERERGARGAPVPVLFEASVAPNPSLSFRACAP